MRFRFSILLILMALTGCQVAKNSTQETPSTSGNNAHETLQATLWVQHAAEYNALTRQAYRSAQHWLDAALQDSSWTAATEQKEQYQSLPPAIILDVDETVLDNSPFQARMIQADSGYDAEAWNEWVEEEKAVALDGAVALTQAAAMKDIQVFYVTNRSAELEEATLDNLIEEGFPIDPKEDVLLLKNERENWGSDKTTRRAYIAQSYRIIMLFGDDLNDFVSAKTISEDRRNALVQQYEGRWGRSWFILPNPVYGSWEGAMLRDHPRSSRQQTLELKQRLLNDAQ
jgi:5'-nucleotidase (lipoprotein e(P4) family)